MLDSAYQVKPISNIAEMDFFINQARREGWNPGLNDFLPFYNTDNHGFFHCTLEGQTIGCISVVNYDSNFAFLGFYIVLPEFRCKGYGTSLMQKAFSYFGSRNTGLDGVILQRESYERYGFKKAHLNARYESIGKIFTPNKNFIPLQEIPFEEIAKYDRRFFPTKRDQFLKNWLVMPNSKCFGIKDRGQLKGYGVIRQCFKGYKIGPLFADNVEIANDLYKQLASTAPNENIYLDLPEINIEALQLVKEHQMNKVFETIRMYTKEIPDFDMKGTFGITTFELG